MPVSQFFNKFPKGKYDINNSIINKKFDDVTDIFFRIAYIKDVLSNVSSYYVFELEEDDTPEIVAEKIYGDAGAAWMIIYANNILDPQFDWPLSYDAFNKFIIDKYGSVANAKTTIHHYEKVVTRTVDLGPEEVVTVNRFIINYDKLTDNSLDVPYDYYENIPEIQDYKTYDIEGRTVVEVIKREEISNYDYEYQLNEDKRTIKVIKSEYYGRIMGEFDKIIGSAAPYIRRVM